MRQMFKASLFCSNGPASAFEKGRGSPNHVFPVDLCQGHTFMRKDQLHKLSPVSVLFMAL